MGADRGGQGRAAAAPPRAALELTEVESSLTRHHELTVYVSYHMCLINSLWSVGRSPT
jgi:hypothetical protein